MQNVPTQCCMFTDQEKIRLLVWLLTSRLNVDTTEGLKSSILMVFFGSLARAAQFLGSLLLLIQLTAGIQIFDNI